MGGGSETLVLASGQANADLGIDVSTSLTQLHDGPPMVLAVRTAQTSANGEGIADDVSHTLDGANGQAVGLPVQGTIIGRGEGAGPHGVGVGEDGDPSFTLTKADQHAVLCMAPAFSKRPGQKIATRDDSKA